MARVVQVGILQIGLDLHSAARVNIGVAGHRTDLGMDPVVREADLHSLPHNHCMAAIAVVREMVVAVAAHMARGKQPAEDWPVALGKADERLEVWRSEPVKK